MKIIFDVIRILILLWGCGWMCRMFESIRTENQPALSNRRRALEIELGGRLLERSFAGTHTENEQPHSTHPPSLERAGAVHPPRRIAAGVNLKERNHNYDCSFFGSSPCLCICYPSGRFGGTSSRARTAVRAHRSRFLPSCICPPCLSQCNGFSAFNPLRSGE